MGAGIYRELIKVQQRDTTARNQYGEPIEKWDEILTTRASYEPLYGREFFSAEQVSSQVEVRFRIRYREGIKREHRILYRGVYYEILYEPIDIEGRHVELWIYCKKVN